MNDVASQTPPQLWQYGVLGVVVVVFALVIKHLYTRNEAGNALLLAKLETKEKEINTERGAWAAERVRLENREAALRQELEERHTELVKNYAQQIVSITAEMHLREASARKDAVETQRQIGETQRHTSETLLVLLQKFYERMTSHTPRSL